MNRHRLGIAIIFFVLALFVSPISGEERSTTFSPIWNGELEKLDSLPLIPNTETSLLYLADGTKPSDMGAYSHHPHVCYHAGRLYAVWSNHLQDEDHPGQRVLVRQSTDLGQTWVPSLGERPEILFPSLDDWKKNGDPLTVDNRTGTANGFAVVDGALYAINEVLPTIFMQEEGVGRLARRINDDGTFGEIFWLETKAPIAPPGYPTYPDLSDPKYGVIGGKINAFLAEKTKKNLLSWDFHGPRNTTTELTGGLPGSPKDGHNLCEPTASYRTSDGILVTFWRDLGSNLRPEEGPSHRLYQSISRDGGDHWSLPERTAIPNANSRPCAGNLPDGTVYLINNPASRKHLVLSLSRDGRLFDRSWLIRRVDGKMRFDGLYKGSYAAAYQHACLGGDFLFVIYSVNKEDVEICRIPLGSLEP